MSAYSQSNSNIKKSWLLIFIFIGLVSALSYGFAFYFNQPFIAFFGILIAIVQSLVAYYAGAEIALSMVGAQEVTPTQAPKLHAMVESLSVIADIPKPRIHISPDKSPNAFAAGRNPTHAHICINKGLLDILNKDELEGVLAHEISHIMNRDILIMTITMALSSVVSLLVDIGSRMLLFGGRSRDKDSNNSPIALLFYVIILVISPILALMIQLAVSRKREFLADSNAVILTRYPEGLISALQKLYSSKLPTQKYSQSMSHLYISPPKKALGKLSQSLFSTHPSLEDRIAALRLM